MDHYAAVVALLEQHELFELLPTHGKVVTLDADLPMKHALAALASHSAMCLPVWDSAQQRFVDVFSCTDLVDILLFSHRALAPSSAVAAGAASHVVAPGAAGSVSGDAQQKLERCQLRDLHGLKRSQPGGFVVASVDDSMYLGCLMLKQHRLECLPLGDAACSSSVLHLLLPEQVLAFLVSSNEFRKDHATLFAATLAEAVLPHCLPLRTVHRDATLADALSLLSAERLLAIPVVEPSGALQDVVSCRDVRLLASLTQTSDLSMRLEDSLRSLPPSPLRLHSCQPSDSLASAITRLANADVAQLVCVDDQRGVCGVITASTVLSALLPPPAGGE